MNVFRTALILFFSALIGAATAAETKTLHSGTWTKKSSKIAGTWKIVADGDAHKVVLGEKFKTKKAPDLKLVLSPHSAEAAEHKNAMQGGKVVAQLKSAKGAQSYTIPDGVDLSKYKSLLIHCEKYTKLWGAGEL